MKKTYFFFLNALIIVFIAAPLSSAQVKTSNSTTTVKAASTKAGVPVQSQAKPAPAVGPTQAKQVPASPAANAPAQAKQPTTANVPAPGQAKPATAVTPVQTQPIPASPAANATTPAVTPVPVPAASSALNQTDTYSYNPAGKPDPFRPFIVVEPPKPKVAAGTKKEGPPSIFPLQRADTTNYKVVGIVGSEDHRMAIAEDSEKKFYPLLIGTRIGLQNGKVAEILADRVIVEEYEKNKAKRVILKLRKN